MSKIENYVQNVINIANDNSHGYSQVYRWGKDYDCSSLVITVVENAGIPVKSKGGATYTGNMLSAFKKCAFADVTNSVNLATGAGLIRGDILLNRTHHTEIYIGNGRNVGAHISETGGVTGRTGDQTEKEICTNNYYNFPWTNVLRYMAEATTEYKKDVDIIAREVIEGKWGNGAARVQKLRRAGYNPTAVQKRVNEILR